MDRHTKLVSKCNQHTTLCGAVQLGHHKAGHVADLAEHLHLVQRVLPCRGVQHQQCVVRRGFVFLANDADDLGQLFHQVGAVLQPPGRVDHQEIGAIGLGLPALASDWGYLREALGPAAISYGATADDLAATIDALTDEQLAAAAAAATARKAETDWSVIAERTFEFFDQIVTGR